MLLTGVISKVKTNDALKLAFGAGIAQALPLITTPIITRLYSPEQFGIYALISSFASFSTSFSTFRIPDLIVIPESETEAKCLFTAAWSINTVVCFLLFSFLVVYKQAFSAFLGLKSSSDTLFLVPIFLFFTSSYLIFDSWFNRKGWYYCISTGQLIRAWTFVVLSILLGFGGLTFSGLNISLLSSLLACFGYQIYKFRKTLNNEAFFVIKKEVIKSTFAKYAKMVATLMVGEGLESFYSNTLVFLIQSRYGAAMLGIYSQASKFTEGASKVISNSFGIVFKRDAVLSYNQTGRFDELFKTIFKKLLKIGVPSFFLGFFLIEPVLKNLLGPEWENVGVYAKILMVSAFFSFIFSPLDKSALIRQKKLYFLIFFSLRLALLLILSSIPIKLEFSSFLIAITSISVFMLSFDFYFSYQFSKPS
jgi:O-antigen/teichoic acid export membrane protein